MSQCGTTPSPKTYSAFENNDLWRIGAAFALHARSIELNRHSMRLGIEIMHSHSCAYCVCFRNSNDFSFPQTKTTNRPAHRLLKRYDMEKITCGKSKNIFVKCVCKGRRQWNQHTVTHPRLVLNTSRTSNTVVNTYDRAGHLIHLLLLQQISQEICLFRSESVHK